MMNPFGLSSIHVQGQLLHNRAKVELLQKYWNQSSKNVEFNYTFPIPHDAQVCSFTLKIGDRVIRSEILETEEAYGAYDTSIAKGDSAAIVEAVSKDILELSAGNIAPGEMVTIGLHYLQEIRWEDDGQLLRWQIPTVLAPRYTSKPGPEAFRTQPHIAPNDTKLQLDLDLFMLRPIQQISSPSHPISVSMGQFLPAKENPSTKEVYQAHIALAKTTEAPDSDIILTISLQESAVMENAMILTSPDQKFSLLQVCPSIAIEPVEEKERVYAFLLDHSGSMGQEKMEQAKLALKLCLRQLSEKDQFMLVAFDDRFSFLSHRPLPFHELNLQKADAWIDSIHSSGGTEIYAPLEYILQKLHPTHENIVLLFTDGQVSDEANIVKLVQDHGNDLQLYPFGIDTAVNTSFLDALATAGSGLAEYIYPGEMMDDKVLRQFSRIHTPFYANGKFLDEAGAELEVFPIVPRKVYEGEFYQFLYKHSEDKPIGSLQFHFEQKEKEKTIPIAPLPADSIEGFDRLPAWWALEKIRFLEALPSLPDNPLNMQHKRDIVALSIQYEVLSTLTSLVAVMPREEKVEGMPEFVKIPVCAPRGWNMDTPCECAPQYDMMNASVELFSAQMASIGKDRASSSHSIDSMEIPIHHKYSPCSLDALAQPNTVSINPVEMAIRHAVLVQNANGSVGQESDQTRATALFVIGMVESGKTVKKYRRSLQKALQWLLDHAQSHFLLVGCALHLGTTRLAFSSEAIESKMQECQLQMNEAEKTVYKEFAAEIHAPLWQTLFTAQDLVKYLADSDEIVLHLLKEVCY